MKTNSTGGAPSFVLGMSCHLALLVLLYLAVLSVPDSWRGRILVPEFHDEWGGIRRSIRDNDAVLWGLMALISVGVSLLVASTWWTRRKWFAVGFLIPTVWTVVYLLKP